MNKRPAPFRPSPLTDSSLAALYGLHTVKEALTVGARKIKRLFAVPGAIETLAPILHAKNIRPEPISTAELNHWLGEGAIHQGILAIATPLPLYAIEEIPDQGLLLVLDQLTDPHNVGAIIRTAAAFQVDAIIMQSRHAPALSRTLAKSASGGLEHVPIISVTNLARSLTYLASRGYWRVGLDSEGPLVFEKNHLQRPLALVLGAEGTGLRRLTRDHCDALARLDMPGAIKSLNVSNACAIALALQAAFGGGPPPKDG